MALTRQDHKRIALHVGHEIQRVLADHNGARLLAKHKARQPAPAPQPSQDDEELESALGGPEDDLGGMEMDAPSHLPMKPKQGFPFSKSGGGMRGRGLKREG